MEKDRSKGIITESDGGLVKIYTCEILNPFFYFNFKRTYANYLHNHFLLYEDCAGGKENLFDIVDNDKPEEADRILYERALDFISRCEIIDDRTRHSNAKAKSK